MYNIAQTSGGYISYVQGSDWLYSYSLGNRAILILFAAINEQSANYKNLYGLQAPSDLNEMRIC